MTISIWWHLQGKEAERIDTAANQREADYLVGEYAMAFGVCKGQHLHGKAVVWAGRKKDDPTTREHWDI